jgi:hypothetical protein
MLFTENYKFKFQIRLDHQGRYLVEPLSLFIVHYL